MTHLTLNTYQFTNPTAINDVVVIMTVTFLSAERLTMAREFIPQVEPGCVHRRVQVVSLALGERQRLIEAQQNDRIGWQDACDALPRGSERRRRLVTDWRCRYRSPIARRARSP